MTKPTGRPKGRPPGRPKGSRDYRPHIITLLEKYKLHSVLLEELRGMADSMTPKERLGFHMELLRIGVMASPKTVSTDGPGLQINMLLSGIDPKPAIRGELVTEPAALPPRGAAVEERSKTYPMRRATPATSSESEDVENE